MTAPATPVHAHIAANPRLGTWLTVAEGEVRVHVGKVELGQGILTALGQLAADALGLPLARVAVVPANSATGPDQGTTAGSLSVAQSAPALRHVGGVVRALAGPVTPVDAYVDRVAALDPDLDLATHEPAEPAPRVAVGTEAPRIDLPDKVLGRPRYLTDLRPERLLHGRVLHPPSPGATLGSVPDDWAMPGVTMVRDGSFLGVVGERESAVDRALELLAQAAEWSEGDLLPDEDDLSTWLRSGEHEAIPVTDQAGAAPQGAAPEACTVTATYSRPYLLHASIAPSAAMARWEADGSVHVWTHSQGIHPLRSALADVLGIDPNAVVVEHSENAGCYGHNGADDAALDAVLLARAMPERPVLLRWGRSDELACGPLAPAMTATLSASLGPDGRVRAWQHDVWGQGHGGRPGNRGAPSLLAAAHLAHPVSLPAAGDPPLAAGGGTTRNAVPIYDVGPRTVTGHRKVDSPLRTSAMRSLGAHLNVFAIESFMDELARTAGVDPLAFRLEHLDDPRAVEVLETAGRLGAWGEATPHDVGRGLGFARYKEHGAYCAVVAEVETTDAVHVRRLTVVADMGEVVNPDGARNQLEGGALQAVSWTLYERVRFDRRRLLSTDWETYPILRFSQAPPVTVHLVGRDAPPVGAGEAAQGPTAAALANAVRSALGVHVRDLPLTPEAIVRAIDEQ